MPQKGRGDYETTVNKSHMGGEVMLEHCEQFGRQSNNDGLAQCFGLL